MTSFFCEVFSEETNNCECEERGKSLQIFVFLFIDFSAKQQQPLFDYATFDYATISWYLYHLFSLVH